jgi:hypothetical protein
MSFLQDNKSNRDQAKRWASFRETNRELIDQVGLPTYRWDHETGEVRKIADDFAAAIKG